MFYLSIWLLEELLLFSPIYLAKKYLFQVSLLPLAEKQDFGVAMKCFSWNSLPVVYSLYTVLPL